ncbi:MFS transporter [Microbacteriaceae bacterium K1510]|nr:MFS transporter [Microbacteriaceae bacterium K1510]
MSAADIAAKSPRETHWRPVLAASIGNALEWFDFIVFGFFAGTIAGLFFPTGNDTVSLLLTFATFGVTFFVRPFGAVILGTYADRHGRKAAFMLTIVLMMAGTAIIAVTPSYASIGVLAPVLMVVARLLQGISAGAEFGSATAFLAEQNPARRGFFASWQFASQGLTTILVTIVGFVLTSTLTPAQMSDWGWRVPFFLGLLIGPVAYYIRRHVDETAEFKAIQTSERPLHDTLTGGKERLAIAFGAVVLCTVGMYTILFMPTYATRQLGLPASGAFAAGFLTGVIQFALIPIVGALSDRIGRLPVAFISAAAVLVAIYPMFWWLTAKPSLETLLIVSAIMGLLLAGYMGGLAALLSELFPTRMRTTGLSISYSFAVALFGGFAPFINAWLIGVTNNNLAPSFYLMLAAAVSLAALVSARKLGIK